MRNGKTIDWSSVVPYMELSTKGGFETPDTVSTTVCENSDVQEASHASGERFLPVSCTKQVISESLSPLFQNESNYENDFHLHKIERVVEQIFI